MDEWIKKLWNIYTICNEILFSHKKEWDLAICDIDGPLGHYAKWNPLWILYDLLYVEIKKQTGIQVHRYRDQIGGCQRWGSGCGRNGL